MSPAQHAVYKLIAKAATEHGVNEGTDYEVTDLQDAIQVTISMLDPGDLAKLLDILIAGESVKPPYVGIDRIARVQGIVGRERGIGRPRTSKASQVKEATT